VRQLQDIVNRPLISVARAAEVSGLSKSAAYRLAAANALPGLVRLPWARLLVRRRVLEDWLAGVEATQSGQDRPGDVGPSWSPASWQRR